MYTKLYNYVLLAASRDSVCVEFNKSLNLDFT